MNGVVSRLVTPKVKPERTYLDLPTEMAEEYMNAVFQQGPTSDESRRIHERYCNDKEWGELFCEFAQSIDELKIAVSAGAAEARVAEEEARSAANQPTNRHQDAVVTS